MFYMHAFVIYKHRSLNSIYVNVLVLSVNSDVSLDGPNFKSQMSPSVLDE
jgi:hypothetical protein